MLHRDRRTDEIPDPQASKVNIAIVAVTAAVVAAVLWRPIVDPFLNRERYRGEVRTLYQNVHPGMSRDEVQREMESGKYPDLRFRRDGQRWSGSAPIEFGAGNWVLAIEFQGDHVSAVRVRKGDGFQDYHHPVEAPPDKVRPRGS